MRFTDGIATRLPGLRRRRALRSSAASRWRCWNIPAVASSFHHSKLISSDWCWQRLWMSSNRTLMLRTMWVCSIGQMESSTSMSLSDPESVRQGLYLEVELARPRQWDYFTRREQLISRNYRVIKRMGNRMKGLWRLCFAIFPLGTERLFGKASGRRCMNNVMWRG